MGSEKLLEIGVKIRKVLIFTIRCCFRSVCNHPFLVGFLCFLILLYRSSPFVFSLLVSAFPVLVCTAVLLGVLLSYGETNLPEIEIETEERKTSFEANGSCILERFGEERGGGSDDTAPLIEERSREIEPDGDGIEGENRELSDLKLKTEWIDEKLNDEVVESDGDKSEADSFDSEKVNVDSLDSPPSSPWTRIEEGDEDEQAEEEEEKQAEDEEAEEEDSGSDSGSDRAESSSPDASMADIMPMLDELHPLLDAEMIPPQYIRVSRSGSDVASERSSESSTEKHESSDESEENHEGLEDDQDDDDDNDDGEDDARGDKEEPTKSAIRWTEEDQKNLMDLGSSEIERNQRLENLILRRRARKYISMAPERNLIDLESIDYPFGLAPISTRRQNPFDDPTHNSYGDNLDLPPIPGSAPSVMLQRRNPFDIPYDSSEEKPDLMGDGFKEEFATSQSRGAVFRRHESFNVGPSVFAPDGKGVRMRPYFVLEGTISEESSYSSSFLRQSSELSESKVSSVPETESTGSVQDLNDRKLLDEDNQQEIEPSPRPNEVVEGPFGEPQLIYHHEEEEEDEEDVKGAPELMSEIEHVPDLVGHGSQSSEDEESLGSGQDELEIQLEDATETCHPDYEGAEGVYRRDSSSSSLSEVSERVFNEIESEELSVLEGCRDLTQTSTESPNLSVSSALAIDIPHRAPVYDSSPRPNENNILQETSITHPMYVDPREHGNVNIDFSEVEKETEIATHEVSISLNLSDEALVVKEHGLTEISASDDEKIHNLDKSSEDQFEVTEPLFEGRVIQLEEESETIRSLDSEHDAYERTDEKKLFSASSVEGNAYPFHDADEIREPNFQHLDDVMASSSLIELEWSKDAQITQNSITSEVQELDHDVPLYSTLSPESLSNPPGAPETTKTDFSVQSETVEQVENIKEINVDLLAELDNVGDFSVQQWGPSSAGFEKHIDSVEQNEIVEDVVHSEKSRGDIDIHEEGVECILEPQIAEASGPEHTEVSKTEFDERNSLDSLNSTTSEKFEAQTDEKFDSFPDEDIKSVASEENEITYTETSYGMPEPEAGKIDDIDVAFKEITAKEIPNVVGPTHVVSVLEVGPIEKEATWDSEQSLADSVDHALHVIDPEELQETFSEQASPGNGTLSGENEAQTANYVRTHNYEGNLSETVGIEAQPDKKTESFSVKAELSENEVLYQSQADTETSDVMTDLEASKVEDIDLAFKEISAEEMIVDFEPVVREEQGNSSVVGPTHVVSVLEVGPIEKDATWDSKQSLSDSVDHALHVIEPEETQETFSERASCEQETLSGENEAQTANYVRTHNYEGNLSVTPRIEVQPDEKTESFSDKAELAENEVLYQGQADSVTTYVMTDLEASKVEDIDLAFKEITAKEIIVKETPAEDSKNVSSSAVGPTLESSVLEVVPIEKDDSLDSKQSLSDSIDRALHVIVSEETKGVSSGFAVTQASVPSEETTLPPNDKVLELLKSKSDDELVEVKADEVGPSLVETRLPGISVPAKKPDREVETPSDSHLIPSVVETMVQISVPAGKPDSEVEIPNDSDSVPSVVESRVQGIAVPAEKSDSEVEAPNDSHSIPSVVESREQGISVPAEKPDSEVEKPNDSHSSIPSAVESRVQRIVVPAEKPDSEVETPNDSHSVKGKDSKSSSSSSSSSSDSSSSDSDKE